MDRQTIYSGQLPRAVDQLQQSQNTMVALAKLATGVFGTNTLVNGFTCTPTTPASLSVLVTAGEIYQIENLEASTWSSLSADTHSILKQGILLDPATFTITPPGTVGYSQNFLVEVQYQDVDSGSTVLPYFNASNPSVPYSGPGNAGTAQNTVRKGIASLQVKAGIAATTGSQTTPSPDAGWTGMFVITVAYGAATITAGNITQYSGAPFLLPNGYLPQIPAGVQSGLWNSVTDVGSTNSIIGSHTPPMTGYARGNWHQVKIANTNTGPTVANFDGLGNRNVIRANGQALQPGDILTGGIALFYDDGASLQLISFNGSTLPRTQKTVYNTPGTFTFTATVNGPHKFSVWGAGGGGGYGGSNLAGSGGSAGAYFDVTKIFSIGQTATIVVGSGGSSGTSSSNGGAGTVSSVTIAGTTYTAGGGPGGLSNNISGSTNSPLVASVTGAVDRSIIGQQGGPGYLMTNPVAAGGYGGSAPIGGLGGVGGGGSAGAGFTPGGGGGGSANSQLPGSGAAGQAWVEF